MEWTTALPLHVSIAIPISALPRVIHYGLVQYTKSLQCLRNIDTLIINARLHPT